ncbi:signal transducer and activator of transcription C-like [Trifolium pratense]|uniref:signal transducer and activator of transcription C-like n=1 Tax=Trifolium pratense TaxID=57577 RepID=UPI001E696E95|nr:signal transducer and activator of transcription C-like [Trifolium pratense]
MDNMSDSYDSTATMPTGRSQRVESIEELEQRLRAEQQQSIASMREEMMTQLRAELSSGIPGQSNQQQFQQQPFQQQPFQHQPFQQQQFQQQPFQQQQQQQLQQQYQRPNQSQRLQNSNNFNYMTGVNYAVQQIQSVGRNSQSSYQPASLHEDPAEDEGYRPGEVDLNVSSDPDENFFTGLQNDPLLQGMLGQQGLAILGELEIPGFTVHDSTSMNQGGIISPLVHSGGNSQGRGVGSSSEMSMGGGRPSAGRASVGRTSAGRAIVGRGSGGRTSAGRRGRGNGQNA